MEILYRVRYYIYDKSKKRVDLSENIAAIATVNGKLELCWDDWSSGYKRSGISFNSEDEAISYLKGITEQRPNTKIIITNKETGKITIFEGTEFKK